MVEAGVGVGGLGGRERRETQNGWRRTLNADGCSPLQRWLCVRRADETIGTVGPGDGMSNERRKVAEESHSIQFVIAIC